MARKAREEVKALEYIRNIVRTRTLSLFIVDVEFQFDQGKLTIYFEATSYFEFKNLVKDIYKVTDSVFICNTVTLMSNFHWMDGQRFTRHEFGSNKWAD
jgi:hypothetical protein